MKFLRETGLIPLRVQQDSSLRPLSVEKKADSVKTRLIEGNQASVPIPEYEGEYIVIPTVENQTLETENKVLKENVLVTAIPYFEVSNIANGITVYIGE